VNRPRTPEAIVEGHRPLAVADEDREAVAELLADVLVAALEREDVEGAA
jgi:hypothetical protein